MLHTLDIGGWNDRPSREEQDRAALALESGTVLYFPRLAFLLDEDERALLTSGVSDGKAKNVSLTPNGKLRGTSCTGAAAGSLKNMIERFAERAAHLVAALVPAYEGRLQRASTSYRPVEIAGRTASAIYDDTRLHVDAFPSRPMRGRRILRVFSNINPDGAPRVWRVGEDFEAMARRFLPAAHEGSRAWAHVLRTLGITKDVRSRYDDLMLSLHDGAKRDDNYQRSSPQTEIRFPPGSTWICYTDQVMHAALAGQYVLEQTLHLDVGAMVAPERSPLRILERLRARALI
ncbi:MAG TPA: Kdo hydroxylase family protein [Rhizomicrobium sp.]|nr:Kdo hydroxylase family protein [Rhizomicrobium sp.]